MWNSVSNAAQNTWNAAVETTKAVVNTVVHVAQETAQAVVQTVQNVVSTVTNAVSNAWNTATRWVGNAWNTVKQWGSNVKSYTQQKIEQARQYAEYVKREAVRKYEQTKQAVNKAKDMGIQLVFKAGMTLQQQLEYTKKIIQICSNKVSAVAEKAKKIGDMAQKSFESAKSWVGYLIIQTTIVFLSVLSMPSKHESLLYDFKSIIVEWNKLREKFNKI